MAFESSPPASLESGAAGRRTSFSTVPAGPQGCLSLRLSLHFRPAGRDDPTLSEATGIFRAKADMKRLVPGYGPM